MIEKLKKITIYRDPNPKTNLLFCLFNYHYDYDIHGTAGYESLMKKLNDFNIHVRNIICGDSISIISVRDESGIIAKLKFYFDDVEFDKHIHKFDAQTAENIRNDWFLYEHFLNKSILEELRKNNGKIYIT